MKAKKDFPVIPKEEYAQRWAKVHAMMDENNMDVLVAFSNDREVFGHAHARWLSDFPTHLESVLFVIAKGKSPVIATGPESIAFIKNRTIISDVFILKEFIHPEEVYHLDNILGLGDIIATAAAGAPVNTIGVAGRHIMDIGAWEAIYPFLSQKNWVDAEDKLAKLRMTKSDAEIAVMRKGYEIAQIAFDAAVDAIAPGVSELEVAAAVKSAMFLNGADGFGIDPMIGAGPNAATILCRSSHNIIKEKDIVRLAIIPKYEGYSATIGRPVFVGGIDKAMKGRLDALCDARQACIDQIKAGVRGEDIEGAGRKTLKQHGFDYTYSGIHSIGYQEFETPIFGPGVEGTVGVNTMLSIEIPLFQQTWGGLHLEDGVRVLEDGAELMHQTPLLIEI